MYGTSSHYCLFTACFTVCIQFITILRVKRCSNSNIYIIDLLVVNALYWVGILLYTCMRIQACLSLTLKPENCYIWAKIELFDAFTASFITFKWFYTNKLDLYCIDTCMWLTCIYFKHTFKTLHAYLALCILNMNTIYNMLLLICSTINIFTRRAMLDFLLFKLVFMLYCTQSNLIPYDA